MVFRRHIIINVSYLNNAVFNYMKNKESTPIKLSVGDIIYHRILGLMVLTEAVADQNEAGFSFKIHGKKLFRMSHLFTENPTVYSLSEKSLYRVRLATDEDIIEELSRDICSSAISPEIELFVF